MDRNPPGDAIAEIAGPKSRPVVASISRIAVAVAAVATVAAVAVAAVGGIHPEADVLSISTVDGGQQHGTTDNPKHSELLHDRSLHNDTAPVLRHCDGGMSIRRKQC